MDRSKTCGKYGKAMHRRDESALQPSLYAASVRKQHFGRGCAKVKMSDKSLNMIRTMPTFWVQWPAHPQVRSNRLYIWTLKAH